MTELLVSSSVLILAVLAVRRLLADRLSKRLQYALWALVLLRLALPFQLPQSRASVMNYLPAPAAAAFAEPGPGPGQPAQAMPEAPAQGGAERPAGRTGPEAGQLLVWGWALGALVCGGWLAAANLRFGRMLKRSRQPFAAPGCRLPVYVCGEGLSTPCLHGLFRPAIYLTPEAAADGATLFWVLRHEEAHWRHGDQVWGALRCACLAAYWFDPLVWAAAFASKKDCELACDEAVTRGLEEAERLAYGRALVALVPARAPAGQRLVAATTQSFNAGQMKRRIEAIARHKKPMAWALAAALVLAALAAACTFTGAQRTPDAHAGNSVPPLGDEQDPAPGDDAQTAINSLLTSLEERDGAVWFTIPESYGGPAADWNIQISGRREVDGMGMSVHYLEQENAEHAWAAGKRYSIPADEARACGELNLQVNLPGVPGSGDYSTGAWAEVDLAAALAQEGGLAAPRHFVFSQADELVQVGVVYGRFDFLQENEAPVQRIDADLNGDGKSETLLLTGEPGDELPYGRLYYIAADGEESMLFEGNYTGGSLQTAAMEDGVTLFWLEETAGTAASAQVQLWGGVNQTGTWGDLVNYGMPAGWGLTHLGGGQFRLYQHSYDMVEMDGSTSGAGDKPYYFYWGGAGAGPVEYGGLRITEEQLKALAPNPSNPELEGLLEQVKEKGELTDILYRANGIVNINYRVAEGGTVSYHNLNLQLRDGAFGLVMGNQHPESSIALETSDFGGTYLPYSSERDVVYPEVRGAVQPAA